MRQPDYAELLHSVLDGAEAVTGLRDRPYAEAGLHELLVRARLTR